MYANEIVSAQKTNSLTTIDLILLESAAKQSTPLALKFEVGTFVVSHMQLKEQRNIAWRGEGIEKVLPRSTVEVNKTSETPFWEKCPNYFNCRL